MAVIAPGEQNRYRGSRLCCDLFSLNQEDWRCGDWGNQSAPLFKCSPSHLHCCFGHQRALKFSLILMIDLRSAILSILWCHNRIYILRLKWMLLVAYGCLISCCQSDVIMSAVKVLLRAFLSKVDVCVLKAFLLITYS